MCRSGFCCGPFSTLIWTWGYVGLFILEYSELFSSAALLCWYVGLFWEYLEIGVFGNRMASTKFYLISTVFATYQHLMQFSSVFCVLSETTNQPGPD